MMFKKFRDRKDRMKRIKTRCYNLGYDHAVKEKNKQIKTIKINHNNRLKQKDSEIIKLKKRVDEIELSLNNFNNLICESDNLIKKAKRNSYLELMLTTEEHGRIEGLNDISELIKRKFTKENQKMRDKILEFKRN